MLLTDIVMIFSLAVVIVAWWRRGWTARSTVLTAFSLVALVSGIAGVLDDRWQGAVGAAAGALILLVVMINRMRGATPKVKTPWISGPILTLLAAFAALMIYWFPLTDLPAPSGQYAVGVRDFELSDDNRKGLLGAGADQPRRLLVRLWYPADDTNGLEPRPYFSKPEVDTTATAVGQFFELGFLFKYVKHSTTNSYVDAPFRPLSDAMPVVIYSHGYTSFAGQNTALMEELASHGYLVYAIHHTYDSGPAVMPNGEVIGTDPKLIEEMLASLNQEDGGISQAMKDGFVGETFDIRLAGQRKNYADSLDQGQRIVARSAPVWQEDRIFVHDRLESGLVPGKVAEIVSAGDYAATGQVGMSFGGSTTGGVCMVDARCAAGINLDGGDYHFTPHNQNIPMPFMMFYSDFQKIAEQITEQEGAKGFGFNDFSYERFETAGLRNDVVRLKVNDVSHMGVSDFTLFMRNPIRGVLLGAINSGDMIQIQNDFVRGFFDTYVKGRDSGFPKTQFSQHQRWVEPYSMEDLRTWWLAGHPEDKTIRVVMETDAGDVELALYPNRAPVSVENFLAYVDGGYYSGASFYRATRTRDGAGIGIVQGGRAAGLMSGGGEETPDYQPPLPPIAHETTDATGIINERGTIAYARLAPGTASSEFFINLSDNGGLDTGDNTRNPDGQGYATFGRVLRGLRVLEKIQSMPTNAPTRLEVVKGQILDDPVGIRRVYRVDAG